MWIKHPYENIIINTDKYADIRCCTVNPTHLDFYQTAVPAGQRGEPNFTIVFKTSEEKEAFFTGLMAEMNIDLEMGIDQ